MFDDTARFAAWAAVTLSRLVRIFEIRQRDRLSPTRSQATVASSGAIRINVSLQVGATDEAV